jgi:hypothetical protein
MVARHFDVNGAGKEPATVNDAGRRIAGESQLGARSEVIGRQPPARADRTTEASVPDTPSHVR